MHFHKIENNDIQQLHLNMSIRYLYFYFYYYYLLQLGFHPVAIVLH
jgi:hypothetical protein